MRIGRELSMGTRGEKKKKGKEDRRKQGEACHKKKKKKTKAPKATPGNMSKRKSRTKATTQHVTFDAVLVHTQGHTQHARMPHRVWLCDTAVKGKKKRKEPGCLARARSGRRRDGQGQN